MCVTANDYMNKLDFTEDDFILSKGIIFSGIRFAKCVEGLAGLVQIVTKCNREAFCNIEYNKYRTYAVER